MNHIMLISLILTVSTLLYLVGHICYAMGHRHGIRDLSLSIAEKERRRVEATTKRTSDVVSELEKLLDKQEPK